MIQIQNFHYNIDEQLVYYGLINWKRITWIVIKKEAISGYEYPVWIQII